MASPSLRLPTNEPGDYYVDETCIDCDACRQIAPTVFSERSGQSAVIAQPKSPDDLLAAQKALISCPTASIGTEHREPMGQALASYPEQVAGDVYRCGFTSEDSFGAFSYLIKGKEGNVLVDSPRFAGPLVTRIRAMGGLSRMVFTHRDDVADHEKFHVRFNCDRVIHQSDVTGATREMEIQPSGNEPLNVARDLLMIPTPGHTRGHVVFLYQKSVLFTGDHLAWDAPRKRLYAFRSACWYSWSEQITSMRRLLDYRFEWVLPGHGRPVHLPAPQMHEALEGCVEWMERVS